MSRSPVAVAVPTLLLVLLLGLAGPVPAAAAPPAGTAPPAVEPVGRYGWPVPGTPVLGRVFDAEAGRYGPGHRGVDLVTTVGTTVLAVGPGVVVFAGQVAGRPVVSVDHPGGLRTTYEPVSPLVAAGQPVARGTPLGTLAAGHGACPGEACLHWGLRRGEVYLDPLTLLVPPRVRLLPWGPG